MPVKMLHSLHQQVINVSSIAFRVTIDCRDDYYCTNSDFRNYFCRFRLEPTAWIDTRRLV